MGVSVPDADELGCHKDGIRVGGAGNIEREGWGIVEKQKDKGTYCSNPTKCSQGVTRHRRCSFLGNHGHKWQTGECRARNFRIFESFLGQKSRPSPSLTCQVSIFHGPVTHHPNTWSDYYEAEPEICRCAPRAVAATPGITSTA